jgi:hypothetical protein
MWNTEDLPRDREGERAGEGRGRKEREGGREGEQERERGARSEGDSARERERASLLVISKEGY